MKNWNSLMLTAAMLVFGLSVQSVCAQSKPTERTSVRNSPTLAIPASKAEAEPLILLEERPERQSLSAQRAAEPKKDGKKLLSACMAAAVELEATRGLVSSLETENEALKERLETEKQATAILRELNETRKSESDSLRAVVIAKNETIAAQDKVILSQDKLVATLKTKKRSPLGRIGDILIGAAIFAVLK